MKYYAFGRVLPERTNVYITFNRSSIDDIGTITFYCESSQISMTLELNDGVEMGPISAQILCKNHASVFISCLAFTLGCNYTVEMTTIIDNNSKGQTFGVQAEDLKIPDEERDSLFYELLNLSGKDFFMRFALMDYVKAINTEVELPFLCYRAIETIKGRFKKQLFDSGQVHDDSSAWAFMHSSLGTNRADIEIVKKSADIIRHGNYYEVDRSTSEKRLRYLEITKECILKYKEFLLKR